MRQLVIDRNRWYRGEGFGGGSLLQPDGKMDCIGFYAVACGVDPENLDVGTPAAIRAHLPREMSWLLGDHWNSFECRMLGWANDMKMDEADREECIAGLFSHHEVYVEFVNGKAPKHKGADDGEASGSSET